MLEFIISDWDSWDYKGIINFMMGNHLYSSLELHPQVFVWMAYIYIYISTWAVVQTLRRPGLILVERDSPLILDSSLPQYQYVGHII